MTNPYIPCPRCPALDQLPDAYLEDPMSYTTFSLMDQVGPQQCMLKLGTADDFQSFIRAPQEELHGLAPVQW
jgi:hypothetical protein